MSDATASKPRMPMPGSTSTWVRMRVVPCRMHCSSVRAARVRTSSIDMLFLSGAMPSTGLSVRRSCGVQRSMIRDLSRWICVSTRPGQARRPCASKLRPSAASRGAIATMRPSSMPMSTGAVFGPPARRALRIMRSKPFAPSVGAQTNSVYARNFRRASHMNALFRSFLAALLACATAQAAAQSYPAKPVHIVVPFPPVGAADLLTRALGNKLTESWGQPVVTDNRPGAGGNIGAEAVAKSTPDGYTLLMAAATTHAVSMSLYPKPGHDLEKDLLPVSLVANVPHILVAHPSVPGKNLAEVIAFLKSQGGKVNFASQGNGTLSHLEFELMKSMGGLDRKSVV